MGIGKPLGSSPDSARHSPFACDLEAASGDVDKVTGRSCLEPVLGGGARSPGVHTEPCKKSAVLT